MSGPKAGGAFVVSGATSAVNSIDTCSILYILPLTTCINKWIDIWITVYKYYSYVPFTYLTLWWLKQFAMEHGLFIDDIYIYVYIYIVPADDMGVVGHTQKRKLPCHLQSERKQKNE